ncbi:CatB-related O-acetyltransferase [Halomonas sp. MC140]|nr:CatB-related O-acetyltransferase [Halomonas sp. MC140]MDN7131955.1 CatB-related O-acetyltransferase [Halomonas sp. MC140]
MLNNEFREKLIKLGVTAKKTMSMGKRTILTCEAPVVLDGDFGMRGNIGAYSYIRSGCRLSPGTKVIGRYCSIAPDVVIGDGDHPVDWLSTHPFQWGATGLISRKVALELKKEIPLKSKIRVGHDVWIGSRAMIMRGVTVGNGAVIAAGSVVTKDVPPYAIVAGVPAKVIRYRFSEDVVQKLQVIKWWDFDIPNSSAAFDFSDVISCLNTLEDLIAADKLKLISAKKVIFDHEAIL